MTLEAYGDAALGDASAVLSFVVGALVFGASAHRRAAGFAAPTLKELVWSLTDGGTPPRR